MAHDRPPLGVSFASIYGELRPALALEMARLGEELGYSSFWTAEVTGPEAFSVLGAVAARSRSLDLGTGVVALQLRTPPLLAMAAATIQSLVPARQVFIGVGISSPVVAGQWHGAPYHTRPLAQMREFVTLLRLCLSGEPVDFHGEFYRVSHFRLGVPLEGTRPKIVVAALNEQMLRLAGEIGDGVLLAYVPATYIPWAVEQVRRGGDAPVYCHIRTGVCDREALLPFARRDLFGYATVDAYASMFEKAGFGDTVTEIRARFRAKDAKGAMAAVSDEMIDSIDVMGDADRVASTVKAYVNGGVDVPMVLPLPFGDDPMAIAKATLEAAAAAF